MRPSRWRWEPTARSKWLVAGGASGGGDRETGAQAGGWGRRRGDSFRGGRCRRRCFKICHAGWARSVIMVSGKHTGLLRRNNVANPTFKPGPYAGESIPAQGTKQAFTAAERASINQIGESTGCHTCGTTNPGTKSGNFVPDHQPVSSLNANNAPQRLYPQCINCSREQGLAAARQLRTPNENRCSFGSA